MLRHLEVEFLQVQAATNLEVKIGLRKYRQLEGPKPSHSSYEDDYQRKSSVNAYDDKYVANGYAIRPVTPPRDYDTVGDRDIRFQINNRKGSSVYDAVNFSHPDYATETRL